MVTKINDSFISPYSHFSVATLICDLQSAGNEKNLQKEILECKKHFNFRLKKRIIKSVLFFSNWRKKTWTRPV